MRIFYSIGIHIAGLVLQFLALFNPKLKLGVVGRTLSFKILEEALSSKDKALWFHCASLGEYEQGLPVFESLKTQYPNHKIVLSFFSPSGYEIRKNSKIADVVIYLPLDTIENAKRFLDLVNPEYILFVKYEIWPNFLLEIKKRQLKAILISAVFRKNQSFFKWYGRWMRNALAAFTHIFTQDAASKTLLRSIGFENVSVSGDTRFDRVSNQLEQNNTLDFISAFKQNKPCVVFGSTWPEDDKLYIDFINKNTTDDLKFIIAPHNIKPSYIQSIKQQMTLKTICFSEMNEHDLSTYQVFILDTIGLLSKVYSYANIAYVGGAAGTTGLHNILEPATFGVPILIGPNHNKFPEAKALIALKGVTVVFSALTLERCLNNLIEYPEQARTQGQINKAFVEKNKGAVVQILNFIRI